MVRSTFYGLEIGRTALTVSQLALDVTSHNIANVDTKGYTRQRIVSTAYDPFGTIGKAMPVTQANVGGGVRVKILDQIRSAYLDRRYRTENTLNGYWQKRVENMTYLESYFDDVVEETSINFSVSEFFKAMKVQAGDAVESAQRTLLRDAGLDLVQQLNSIYTGLIDLQKVQNDAVKITIEDINRISAELVELNKAIYGFELTGLQANDLRDKRNLLLDELSQLVPIEYNEYPDGMGSLMLEVKIGDKTLVKHDKYNELGVELASNVIPGEADVWIPVWKPQRAPGPPILDVYLPGTGGGADVHLTLTNLSFTKDQDEIKKIISVMNHVAGEFNKLHVKINSSGELEASDELPKPQAEEELKEAKRLYAILNSIIETVDGTVDGKLSFDCDEGGHHAVIKIGNEIFARSAGCILSGDATPQVTYIQDISEPIPMLPLSVRGGELMAYIDMRDGQGPQNIGGNGEKGIPYYIEMLNNLARALVQEVNTQHRAGWTDPPNGVSQTGINFFSEEAATSYTYDYFGTPIFPNPDYPATSSDEWIDGVGAPVTVLNPLDIITTASFNIDLITAKNISLSAEVMASVFNIAASSVKVVRGVAGGDKEELQSGNNKNMNELYKLFEKEGISIVLGGGTIVDIGSLDGYVTTLRFDVGNTLSFAEKTADNCTILTLAAENQRLSVSGVSLDEEMINMVKYQHAYNGAARVITVMDELLDKLINGTGRVGL